MAVSEPIRRGAAALLVAGGLALSGAGCGGDDETTDTAPLRTGPATATDGTATATDETATTETTTEQTVTDDSGGVAPPETAQTETTDDSGSGGVSPGYNPAQPDSPANNVPPEPGSPQDKFEQYCNKHPDACG